MGDATPRSFAQRRADALAWAQYRAPNYLLFIGGLVYLTLGIGCYVIGLGVLHEHVEDLKENPSLKHIGSAENARSQPAPCGLPTPDMLHLLTALGQYNGATQFLTADYPRWYGRVHGALCGLNYREWEDADDNDDDPVYNRARYTYILANLMDRHDLMPDVTKPTDNWNSAKSALDNAWCDDKEETRVYSKRQQRVYGEMRDRIARAYISAAPAFYRYKSWFEAAGNRIDANNAGPLTPDSDHGCFAGIAAAKRPFLESESSDGAADLCMNYELIKNALDKAGDADAMLRLIGEGDQKTLPDAQEMAVALLALSVIGHVDRTENNGQCFRYGDDPGRGPDAETRTAQEFCAGILGDETLAGSAKADPMGEYSTYVQAQGELQACNEAADARAEPTYTRTPYDRSSAKNNVIEVCAEMLQYGLFNQEKLFGVPDPVADFAADARPEVMGHAVAHSFIDSWWTKAVTSTRFNDPIWRLEAYMAYRLAMTTYWGMLIGSVVGYFLARAAAPLSIQILAQAGIAKDKDGVVLTLGRPKFELPLFIASIVGFVTAWWLIWIDPSTQSHYPIDTSCSDWSFDGPHSTSGVYITTWTRPRSTRFPPALLGPILGAISVMPLLLSLATFAVNVRKFRRPKRFDRSLAAFFGILIGVGLVQGAYALQSEESGRAWHDKALAGTSTTEAGERYAADCLVAVYASFWTGGVVGWARSRWALGNAKNFIKVLWIGVALLFAAMPFVQARTLIGAELFDNTVTFEGDKATDRTRHNYTMYLALPGTVLVGLLVAFLGYSTLEKTAPAPPVAAAKDELVAETVAPFLSPEVRRLMDMKVLEPMPVHDATGATGGGALASRAYGAYRITRSTARGGIGYRPMLRVSTQF